MSLSAVNRAGIGVVGMPGARGTAAAGECLRGAAICVTLRSLVSGLRSIPGTEVYLELTIQARGSITADFDLKISNILLDIRNLLVE